MWKPTGQIEPNLQDLSLVSLILHLSCLSIAVEQQEVYLSKRDYFLVTTVLIIKKLNMLHNTGKPNKQRFVKG